jgi:hypothetical protein
MLIKRTKERNIAGLIKGKMLELIPNRSIGSFILNDNINNYLHFKHEITHHANEDSDYDTYSFSDYELLAWVENSRITTLRCTKECYWQDINLIRMPFEQFLSHFNVIPNKSETLYTLIDKDHGQNQKVYDFDDLGLIIWVCRNKIVTILAYNNQNITK